MKKSPEQQTVKEWQDDFGGQSPASLSGIFVFDIHRTTRDGSVALEFICLDERIKAVKFFNVSLQSSRGTSYPAKAKGQFIPPKRGNFCRFYLDVVGKPPRRWSRVHQEMYSRFKGIKFYCEYEPAMDKKGNGYFRITNVSVYDDIQF